MKNPQELTRRDFHRLTAAAFGGVVAGAAIGCGEAKPPAKSGTTTGDKGTPAGTEVAAALEPHACRGLNACKSDKNACAGQSTCANVKHDCAGENACKNQGGCGDNPGANECKTKGGCSVPMDPAHGAWPKARAAFEKRMEAAGKKFGPAPEAAAAKPEEAKPAEPKPVEPKPEEAKKPDDPKPEDKKE